MKRTWLIAVLASGLLSLAASAAAASSGWEQPAAGLAQQIAEILGPGQAHLTIRNQSTISTDEIPTIRRLLAQELKTRGVLASGAESANTIRVTLSENLRERLWVAEVIEGNETRVAMVHVDLDRPQQAPTRAEITLRSQTVITASEPILAVIEGTDSLVLLEPEELVLYARETGEWRERKKVSVGTKRPLARDPRGILSAGGSGQEFEAWLAGTHCTGGLAPVQSTEDWTVHCNESDDPWPISGTILASYAVNGSTTFKAFYNAGRDYFTGVVTPSMDPNLGVDLPPFYSAALLPRLASGGALVINGIDGKVELAENGSVKPVSGTRDWGSDFAVLHSGCGAGTQIIASGSGEAIRDSLRAYELPALEAVPASAPLAVDGTVTALWSAPDGKSAFAVVRSTTDQYEVDRVSALCN